MSYMKQFSSIYSSNETRYDPFSIWKGWGKINLYQWGLAKYNLKGVTEPPLDNTLFIC